MVVRVCDDRLSLSVDPLTNQRHPLEAVTSVTNDLRNFCPLGTLFFYGLPRVPANGAEAQDGWFWFDPPYDYNHVLLCPSAEGDRTMSPLLFNVRYLIDRGYVRATYKVIRLSSAERLLVMRIYALPGDSQGIFAVLNYRENMSRFRKKSWSDAKYKAVMGQLLAVLDFSAEAWNLETQEELCKHVLRGVLVFPMTQPWVQFRVDSVGSSKSELSQLASLFKEPKTRVLSLELQRMVEECEVNPNTAWASSLSINVDAEARLLETYENVKSPSFAHLASNRVSKFQKEVVQSILDDDIPGLKSDMYTYQRESVAKMLEREYFPEKAVVPNLLVVHTKKSQPGSASFYFDMNTFQTWLVPETFTTPRGGILAENMGLGKTFICLALICASKLEISEIPPQFSALVRRDAKVQSLSTYCVRKVGRESIPWKMYIDRLPSSCVQLLERHVGYFEVSELDTQNITDRRSRLRSESDLALKEKRKVFTCSTTLVVAPDNIWHQWAHEIDRHVQEGFLNVLYLREKDVLASVAPEEIIKYDVVLMTSSCFVRPDSVNLMKQVHWKRFIIDEGHSMTSKTSNAVYLARAMSADRKWAITGTPTAGLTRLHVNEAVDKETDHGSSYTAKKSFDAKDDLSRLGAIVTNFLKIDPWASSHKLWKTSILDPFLTTPHNFNIQLQSFLSYVLVRHSMADVENEVKLPPLHHKAVFLEPSFFDKLSINLYTAVLATNAVTSERTDKDYMFHPNNRSQLRRLITNLRRATFYWTGFTIDDLNALVSICKSALEKKSEDGKQFYSMSDKQLLVKSVYYASKALSNPRWRTASAIQEMNYYVAGLPQMFESALSIELFSHEIAVYGAPQLQMVQRIFSKSRFVQSKEVLEERLLEEVKPFWANYWKKAAGKNTRRTDRNEVAEKISFVEDNTKFFAKGKRSTAPSTQYALSQKQESQNSKLSHHMVDLDRTEDILDQIRNSRIVGTASSKLSYMAARLLEHQLEGVKSIVFYEFEDSAYYLTEFLDILGVDYLMYATYLKVADRPRNLDEFRAKAAAPGGLTLVMDLKLAAHGLNIVSATRVYFLNPVWDRAVEAQAVKRAHRIGQKHAVRVETLMLKNTIEQEMYNKRFKDGGDEITEVSDHDLIDDTGMQEFVMRHEFLEIRKDEQEFLGVMAPAVNPEEKLGLTEDRDGAALLDASGALQKGLRVWDLPLLSQTALERQIQHELEAKRRKQERATKRIKLE